MSVYNKILSTVNTVSTNYSFIPIQNNVIVIDTSTNRIGINTVNPNYSIDVCYGTIQTQNLYVLGDISLNNGLLSRTNNPSFNILLDTSYQTPFNINPFPFGSIVKNTANYYNIGNYYNTSSYKFIAPINGTYNFNINLQIEPSFGGIVTYYKNINTIISNTHIINPYSINLSLNIPFISYLNNNDSIQIDISSISISKTGSRVVFSSNANNGFSGVLI